MALLDDVHGRAAMQVGRVLRDAGHQAWLVGGCVRDLALGRSPKDVDMVTDALPEKIEELFPRTLGVGKAFGTMLVQAEVGEPEGRRRRVDIEVSTFRAEGDYSDGRRPDQVTYCSSAEIDASRRDFTCNALYLDPLDGTLLDPCEGMEDLRAGLLRTVGGARERFREDGLRLWRMARFQAQLGLQPAAGLHEAARLERESLRGVSPERVHVELAKLLLAPEAARGLAAVEECDLWPGGWQAWSGVITPQERARRIACISGLEPSRSGPAHALRLAHLLAPARAGSLEPLSAEEEAPGLAALDWLRPSRAEREAIRALWSGLADLGEALAEDAPTSRKVRLLRRGEASEILQLARGLAPGAGSDSAAQAGAGLAELETFRDGPAGELLALQPWISSKDLLDAGLQPGPSFGALLIEAEDGQLDGRWASREEAMTWLRGQTQS